MWRLQCSSSPIICALQARIQQEENKQMRWGTTIFTRQHWAKHKSEVALVMQKQVTIDKTSASTRPGKGSVRNEAFGKETSNVTKRKVAHQSHSRYCKWPTDGLFCHHHMLLRQGGCWISQVYPFNFWFSQCSIQLQCFETMLADIALIAIHVKTTESIFQPTNYIIQWSALWE